MFKGVAWTWRRERKRNWMYGEPKGMEEEEEEEEEKKKTIQKWRFHVPLWQRSVETVLTITWGRLFPVGVYMSLSDFQKVRPVQSARIPSSKYCSKLYSRYSGSCAGCLHSQRLQARNVNRLSSCLMHCSVSPGSHRRIQTLSSYRKPSWGCAAQTR